MFLDFRISKIQQLDLGQSNRLTAVKRACFFGFSLVENLAN